MKTYYRSYRIVGGKPKWVLIDECNNIIEHNPTKEQINLSIDERYIPKSSRMCCKCGKDETTKNNWYKYRDKIGKWDNKSYICHKCHMNDYNSTYDDDRKITSKWRNGRLDPASLSGKGFIGQQIVSQTYGVEDCNLKMENFNFYVDLNKITGYGYSDVKTSSFDGYRWHFADMVRKCDTFFFVCMDNNWPWKNVMRMYAIPCWEIFGESNIHIYGNFRISRSKWKYIEEFRIDKKPFNYTYHNMRLENCKVLKRDESI